ncbi:MAG: multicopper oxidase family protein [Polyangiaceae bacterium]|nr:multicopper oxidase family protein [Polyangiaceae bacterium]
MSGCGPAESTPADPGQPDGWDSELSLNEAEDLNADPDVVEIDLTAKEADVQIREKAYTTVWTYNGGIPGPLVRAKVGDRVVVHFHNELPDPTTVHWHGVRLTADMDGAPDMPHPPVKKGETFTYDFVVPDAGLYWYHPHVDSAAQVGAGLYGALLVEDPNEPKDLGDELTMVLSDIGIEESGQLQSPDVGGELGSVFGREGDSVLVNGRVRPEMVARAGRRQRWRLVNAARSRYFWLDLEGTPFVRIGGDGGLMSSPVTADRLLLVPGERADVLVVPVDTPGETRTLRWIAYDRGYGTAFERPPVDLLSIEASDLPAEDAGEIGSVGRDIEVINTVGATPVEIALTMDQSGETTTLGINGVPFGQAPPIAAAVGETQVWTVKNEMAWAHPFHLHGFFFQLLDANGAALAPLEWKDTANVPVEGQMTFAVRYDPRPGMWMFHCHILDHAELGMMGMVNVEK